jgi:sugar/nucleoside kinase (ribokinase family)
MDRTNKDHSPDVLGIGLCTVDMLFVVAHRPDFDVSTRASQYLRQGAGPAATAMVALARLGAQAAFIGKVGDDGTWLHEDLDNFLPLVDVAIVSEPFVRRFLAGLSPEQVVKKLASYGIALAVYTRGVDGCIAYWQGQIHRFPAFSVEVVDTTGAGDAFHGAFIYGLLREWHPERIIPFASATAALNCRALGGAALCRRWQKSRPFSPSATRIK